MDANFNSNNLSFNPITLDAEDLGKVLRKERAVILKLRREDIHKAPGETKSLPVDCTPEGSKTPIWLMSSVLAWLQAFENQRIDQNIAIAFQQPKRMGAPTKAQRVEKRNAQLNFTSNNA